MAFGGFKPKTAFHMPSENKRIADDTIRRKKLGGISKPPKMKLNPGLAGLKIKL
jgi:hypothetical protein